MELDVSHEGFDDYMTEYPCVLKTDTEWRMWYCGNHYASIGYATAQIRA